MPPLLLPLAPSIWSTMAVSNSIEGGAAGGAGAANGVLLSAMPACSAAASFTGSPWPYKCMYMVKGRFRSRWLCTAVISIPPAISFAMTGLTSSSVSTRSPITIACSPTAEKASQPPSAKPDLMSTPSSVTLRSVRGKPTRYTPPGMRLPFLPSASPTLSQAGSAVAGETDVSSAAQMAIANNVFIALPSCSGQRPDGDAVEIGDAVGLGPQRHFPAVSDGSVLGREELLAVEGDGETAAFGLEREAVPRAADDLEISPGELLALPLHHPVEADVVFERIGARDVIIVRRLQADDDPARLVDASRHRLEAQRGLQVCAGEGLVDCKREAVAGAVFAHLGDGGAARGGRVADDGPFAGRALSGAP